MSNINLGVQCYPGNNKSKLRLLLASLLIKYDYTIYSKAFEDYNKNYFSKLLAVINKLKLKITNNFLNELKYVFNKCIYKPDVLIGTSFGNYEGQRKGLTIHFKQIRKENDKPTDLNEKGERDPAKPEDTNKANKQLVPLEQVEFDVTLDKLPEGLTEDFVEAQIIAYLHFYENRVDDDKHLPNYNYLITSIKTMYFLMEIKDKQFNSIQEVIDISKNYGFKPIKSNNIKVNILVDSITGQKYEDFEDFWNRLEENDLEKIDPAIEYIDFISNRGNLKALFQTKYINDIRQGINKKLEDIVNELFTKLEELARKQNKNIDFSKLNKYDFIAKCQVKNGDKIKQCHEFLTGSDANVFKAVKIMRSFLQIDIREYIKDYDELPDLKSVAKEYFEKIYQNINQSGIDELKSIYTEFNKLYPNSCLSGTKYHTNAMISRNVFLGKHYKDYNFIIDDDDFSSSLDDRNDFINYYKNLTENIYQNSKVSLRNKIRAIDHSAKCLNAETVEDFRRLIYTWFKYPLSARKLSVYKDVNKIGVIRFRGIIKTNRIIKGVTQIEQKSVHCCGVWSTVFPPYTLNNYMNVQEMMSDDVGYMEAHAALHNHALDTAVPIYYYIDSGYAGYGRIEDANPEFVKRIHALKTIQMPGIEYYAETSKQIKKLDKPFDNRLAYQKNYNNFGKYYYKYDSIVPYIDNTGEHLVYVSEHLRQNRNIKQNFDYKSWNEKLSKEELLQLHY